MKEERKTKAQLIDELAELRQRVAKLEAVDTERKRAEEALRESEQKYQSLSNELEAILDYLPALVFYKDKKGNFIRVNKYVADAHHLSKEELEGKSTFELYPKEQAQAYLEDDLEVIESGKPKLFIEEPWEAEEGKRWVSTSKIPFVGEKGETLGVVGVSIDITERKRAEAEILRRTAQLEALRRVGLEITAELDLDSLLHSIVSQAVELAGGTAGGLCLYRPDLDALMWVMAVGPNLAPIGTVLQRGEDLSGRVWETGEPLIVDDYRQWEGRAVIYEDYPWTAIVGVPVYWRDKFLGVLNVLADAPHTFSPADAELLSLFATQAAIAVRNACLFEGEHEQRELSDALAKAAAVVSGTLNSDKVLDRILEQVSRVVPNDATNIMLIGGDQARVVRCRGYERFGAEELVSTLVLHIPETVGFQQMIESKEPMVVPDTATFPGWVQVQEWLSSYAAAPIIVRGEVIGFLNVDSATPGFFTQADAETLRAFAGHAAAGIENARLYEAEQERRHISETLRQASTVFSSTLELSKVLELILQQLRQVIPCGSASVQRLQDEHLEIIACQGFERPDKVVGLIFPLDPRFPNHRVVATKTPLVTDDVVQDYPHFQEEADTYESGRIRSWLGVPLMVKGEIIGMIAVDRTEVRPYTAEEVELAVAFANQSAIAIENARLYEETQQELAERKRAEQALRESEEKHRTLVEQSLQGIVVAQGAPPRLVFANLAMSEILGYSVDELTSLSPEETQALVHAEDRAVFFKRFSDRLEGKPAPPHYEIRGIRKDGEVRWLEVSGSRIEYQGQPAVQAAFVDITERKRVEEALRESESKLSSILSSMVDLVFAFDSEGRFTFCHAPPFGEVLYLPPDEFIGKRHSEVMPPHICRLFTEAFEKNKKGEAAEYEYELRVGGRAKWFSAKLSPVFVDGEFTGSVAVVRDITERKRAEEAFRESEKRYRTLFAESQRQAQELALLSQVRTALAGELDLPTLFCSVVEAIADTFGYTLVSLYLLQDDVLVLQHQVGYDQVIERIPITQGVTGRVAHTGQPVLLEDVHTDGTFLGAIEGIVSEVCVPLFDQGRVVGVLNVESSKGVALGEVDLRLMTALSEHISVAIGRARLYTEVQESEDRYVDLYDNAPDMYFTVRRDGTILSVNRLGAEMLGYQKEELIGKPVAVVFHPEDVASVQRQIDGILQSKKGISKLDFRKIRKDGSEVYVSERVSLHYDPQGEPILRIICRDITERKRVEEEIRRRTAQLEALRQVGLEITAELDLDTLLHSIASRAIELVGGASGGLYLYQPERDVLEWSMAIGPNLAPIGTILHRGEGLSGRVWETGEPIMVDDYGQWEGQAAIYKDYSWTAVVGVPVNWGEEFLGVLDVQAEPSHTFSPADAELLSLFATQAAIAIRNARLFESEREQRALTKALEEAAAVITSTLDLDQLLDRILQQVSRVVPNDATNIMLIEGDEVRIARWRGYESFGAEEFLSTAVFRIPELPNLREMLESSEPIVIPDTAAYPGWVELPVQEWLRSYAAAPIVVRGEVIGFLNVDSATPGFFTQADAEALRTFADHAAAAIENARLYAEAQRRLKEQTALREAGAFISSTLDPQTVLSRIAEQMCRAVEATSAYISSYEPRTVVAHVLAEYISPQACAEEQVSDLGIAYVEDAEDEWLKLMKSGQYDISHIDAPDLTKSEQAHMQQFGAETVLYIPLRIKGQLIGYAEIWESRQRREFTPEEIALCQGIAQQAAVAIENARLYEQAHQEISERKQAEKALEHRAAQLATVGEIGRQIASILDLDELLHQIVNSLEDAFGYRYVYILLLDEDSNELVARAGAGAGRVLEGTRIPLEARSINAHVARTGGPLLANDVSEEPTYLLLEEIADTESELAVPIKIKEQVIGTLDVQSRELNAFDESDLATLQTLADQAAIAIETARLFAETERRANDLALLLDTSTAISSTLDLDQILKTVARQITSSLVATFCRISLLDETGENLVIRAVSPIRDWEAEDGLGRPCPLTAVPWHKQVIEAGQPVVLRQDVPELALSDGECEMALAEGVKSAILVPLIVGGRVLGVISLGEERSWERSPFPSEKVDLCQSIARQAAVAIENARLYEEADKLRAFSENIVQSMEEGILLEDATGHITFVNPRTAELLDYAAEELMGQHWRAIVLPERVAEVEEETARRPQNVASRYETILLTREGRRVPVIVSARPLFDDGRFTGVLSVFTDITKRKGAEEELRQSYVRLQRTLEGTVNALVSAIEMRDRYTAGHQRGVARLACAIANEMGLPEEQIEGIRMAGLIHDLGKITVPAEILSKPGRLTDMEYGLIKAHPEIGYDVLKTIAFPWPVAQIVLQHHERMDGSGYPHGLRGEEILLEAKILAVADVVEAMASFRPYRPALGVDKALEEISQNGGVLYDSGVVGACLKLFNEKGFELE